jgi:hypothetical protein
MTEGAAKHIYEAAPARLFRIAEEHIFEMKLCSGGAPTVFHPVKARSLDVTTAIKSVRTLIMS